MGLCGKCLTIEGQVTFTNHIMIGRLGLYGKWLTTGNQVTFKIPECVIMIGSRSMLKMFDQQKPSDQPNRE